MKYGTLRCIHSMCVLQCVKGLEMIKYIKKNNDAKGQYQLKVLLLNFSKTLLALVHNHYLAAGSLKPINSYLPDKGLNAKTSQTISGEELKNVWWILNLHLTACVFMCYIINIHTIKNRNEYDWDHAMYMTTVVVLWKIKLSKMKRDCRSLSNVSWVMIYDRVGFLGKAWN